MVKSDLKTQLLHIIIIEWKVGKAESNQLGLMIHQPSHPHFDLSLISLEIITVVSILLNFINHLVRFQLHGGLLNAKVQRNEVGRCRGNRSPSLSYRTRNQSRKLN